MVSEHMIIVSKGNLFKHSFTEDWHSEAHISSEFLRPPFGETRQRLSIYNLDKVAWDNHINTFLTSDIWEHNNSFWSS